MKYLLLLALASCINYIHAQNLDEHGNPKNKLKVLVVTAHPDDETGMAATVYKITHDLGGQVDQCVITNGEGGYKYSTLSEAYYGLELTDEKVGRANLPRIRKQELMNAGKIIGTNNIFFLDQKDAKYGLDEHEPMDTSWDTPWISKRLHEIMTTTKYDFVFCLLPVPETHGGHKAATLLALRAVQSLPTAQRPTILGCDVWSAGDSVRTFKQLKDYTETSVVGSSALYSFDRTVKFGYKNALNYKTIVNWEIAEHKSQGTMQLYVDKGDQEHFWFFAINAADDKKKCAELFERLKVIPYPKKAY